MIRFSSFFQILHLQLGVIFFLGCSSCWKGWPLRSLVPTECAPGETEGSFGSDEDDLAVEEGSSATLIKRRRKTAGAEPGHAIVGQPPPKVPNTGFVGYGSNCHWVGGPQPMHTKL
jgi:hypothetical protein